MAGQVAYGPRVIYDAASSFEATLCRVLKDKEWHWRSARSEDLVKIRSKLQSTDLKENYRVIWTATPSGKFGIAATWNHLQRKKSKVPCWRLIWFSAAIPKHSFIGWLAMNGLSTNLRLIQWGNIGDSLCSYCRMIIETRKHLFFECPFSKRIWQAIMELSLVPSMPYKWEEVVNWGINLFMIVYNNSQARLVFFFKDGSVW